MLKNQGFSESGKIVTFSCDFQSHGSSRLLDGFEYLIRENRRNSGQVLEPYLPNYMIGIMHLAACIWKNNKDMRLDKSVKIEIKTLEDKTISKSLRFIN